VLSVAYGSKERLCFEDLTHLWIVSDSITRADAVAVLGGGLEYRPFVAADLYKEGVASRVLVSRASLGHGELNRKALLKLGVPDAAIEMFGTQIRTTKDEALALKDWAEQNAASVLIVPSEIFAARRVRWIFNREFHGTAVRIQVPGFEEDFNSRRVVENESGSDRVSDRGPKIYLLSLQVLSAERFL
jgi:DUF218 domain